MIKWRMAQVRNIAKSNLHIHANDIDLTFSKSNKRYAI